MRHINTLICTKINTNKENQLNNFLTKSFLHCSDIFIH